MAGKINWLLTAGVFLVIFFILNANISAQTPFPAPVIPTEPVDIVPADIDQSLHAAVLIPALGINVPVVWSLSYRESDLQKDLEQGVIHFPGTVLPGQVGNALISGHSSDYLWKPGNFKRAFANLNELNVGDEGIFVEYYDADRNVVASFAFRVTDKKIVAADDPQLFAQTDQPELTLVTCWPLNTSWRRLMIKAEKI